MLTTAKFDPEAQFVVRKTLTIDGVSFFQGDRFPKEAVSARRLRQLFSSRWILAAPAPEPDSASLPEISPKKEKKRGI
jgi:hypothetical protein